MKLGKWLGLQTVSEYLAVASALLFMLVLLTGIILRVLFGTNVALVWFGLVFGLCYFQVQKHGHRAFGYGPVPSNLKTEIKITNQNLDKIRIVCISDTHNEHGGLEVPDGDILIHAGDFTKNGTLEEVVKFNTWLGKLPHQHKIIIAGNHDLVMDQDFYKKSWRKWHKKEGKQELGDKDPRSLLTDCIYLENEAVDVEGLKFYGSPCSPHIPNYKEMAFNVRASAKDRFETPTATEVWDQIPENTDILVTHTPPLGILDRLLLGKRVGCKSLRQRIDQIKPRLHVFGHIHEDYGIHQDKETSTIFANASMVTMLYTSKHKCLVIDLPRK